MNETSVENIPLIHDDHNRSDSVNMDDSSNQNQRNKRGRPRRMTIDCGALGQNNNDQLPKRGRGRPQGSISKKKLLQTYEFKEDEKPPIYSFSLWNRRYTICRDETVLKQEHEDNNDHLTPRAKGRPKGAKNKPKTPTVLIKFPFMSVKKEKSNSESPLKPTKQLDKDVKSTSESTSVGEDLESNVVSTQNSKGNSDLEESFNALSIRKRRYTVCADNAYEEIQKNKENVETTSTPRPRGRPKGSKNKIKFLDKSQISLNESINACSNLNPIVSLTPLSRGEINSMENVLQKQQCIKKDGNLNVASEEDRRKYANDSLNIQENGNAEESVPPKEENVDERMKPLPIHKRRYTMCADNAYGEIQNNKENIETTSTSRPRRGRPKGSKNFTKWSISPQMSLNESINRCSKLNGKHIGPFSPLGKGERNTEENEFQKEEQCIENLNVGSEEDPRNAKECDSHKEEGNMDESIKPLPIHKRRYTICGNENPEQIQKTAEQCNQVTRRARGRPKGSKNKVKKCCSNKFIQEDKCGDSEKKGEVVGMSTDLVTTNADSLLSPSKNGKNKLDENVPNNPQKEHNLFRVSMEEQKRPMNTSANTQENQNVGKNDPNNETKNLSIDGLSVEGSKSKRGRPRKNPDLDEGLKALPIRQRRYTVGGDISFEQMQNTGENNQDIRRGSGRPKGSKTKNKSLNATQTSLKEDEEGNGERLQGKGKEVGQIPEANIDITTNDSISSLISDGKKKTKNKRQNKHGVPALGTSTVNLTSSLSKQGKGTLQSETKIGDNNDACGEALSHSYKENASGPLKMKPGNISFSLASSNLSQSTIYELSPSPPTPKKKDKKKKNILENEPQKETPATPSILEEDSHLRLVSEEEHEIGKNVNSSCDEKSKRKKGQTKEIYNSTLGDKVNSVKNQSDQGRNVVGEDHQTEFKAKAKKKNPKTPKKPSLPHDAIENDDQNPLSSDATMYSSSSKKKKGKKKALQNENNRGGYQEHNHNFHTLEESRTGISFPSTEDLHLRFVSEEEREIGTNFNSSSDERAKRKKGQTKEISNQTSCDGENSVKNHSAEERNVVEADHEPEFKAKQKKKKRKRPREPSISHDDDQNPQSNDGILYSSPSKKKTKKISLQNENAEKENSQKDENHENNFSFDSFDESRSGMMSPSAESIGRVVESAFKEWEWEQQCGENTSGGLNESFTSKSPNPIRVSNLDTCENETVDEPDATSSNKKKRKKTKEGEEQNNAATEEQEGTNEEETRNELLTEGGDPNNTAAKEQGGTNEETRNEVVNEGLKRKRGRPRKDPQSLEQTQEKKKKTKNLTNKGRPKGAKNKTPSEKARELKRKLQKSANYQAYRERQKQTNTRKMLTRQIPQERLEESLTILRDSEHPVWEERNTSCLPSIHYFWNNRPRQQLCQQKLRLKYARQYLLRRDWVNLCRVLCITAMGTYQHITYLPILAKFGAMCLAHNNREQFDAFMQMLVNMDDGRRVLKKVTQIPLQQSEEE
ncbi:uncharacterized protein [Musca autumnalis]|uniref:uncharacterized protein n=1 Tax=Musca autumnalis TaxID=221902 RepID=UPI003CE89AEE